ncbi:MAG: spore cortex biosynthesis protein YabQ, partial [Thermaerobacterales bacterium]
MPTLDIQLYMFAVIVATGMVLGVWYDVYRAVRGAFFWRGPLADLFDAVFWLVVALVVLSGMILGNWVDFRLYVLVGLAIGLWSYMVLASPVIFAILSRCCGWIRRFVNAAGRAVRTILEPVQKGIAGASRSSHGWAKAR